MGDGYTHSRPRDDAFYDAVVRAADTASWREPAPIGEEGLVLELVGGDLLAVALEDGPQIVHLDAWATDDPADRLWPQETSGVEGCFIGTGHRLWSTMPRFRPLLSVVGDTLGEPTHRRGIGRHHLVLSGWDLPATWEREGGVPGVPTAWERFRELRSAAGVDPSLHRDAVSLFQHTWIDPLTQRMRREGSLAMGGDRVTVYAEVALTVALVPSPWRDGGRPASACDGSVAATSAAIAPSGLAPVGWPTPGVPYPDIRTYQEGLR